MHCIRPIPESRCCSGTVEKFSGDQERALLVPFVILFPLRFVCAGGRKYKKRLREAEEAPQLPRQKEVEYPLEGYPPAVPRDSDSFSSRKTGYWYCANFPGTFLPAPLEMLAVLERSTAIKTYLPKLDVNNLRRPFFLVTRVSLRATFENSLTSTCYVRIGDTRFIKCSHNCSYAPVLYEESWPVANHRFSH